MLGVLAKLTRNVADSETIVLWLVDHSYVISRKTENDHYWLEQSKHETGFLKYSVFFFNF